jgi:hypothetical protein
MSCKHKTRSRTHQQTQMMVWKMHHHTIPCYLGRHQSYTALHSTSAPKYVPRRILDLPCLDMPCWAEVTGRMCSICYCVMELMCTQHSTACQHSTPQHSIPRQHYMKLTSFSQIREEMT